MMFNEQKFGFQKNRRGSLFLKPRKPFVNKQDVLFPNVVLKIIYAFLSKGNEYF